MSWGGTDLDPGFLYSNEIQAATKGMAGNQSVLGKGHRRRDEPFLEGSSLPLRKDLVGRFLAGRR